MVQQPGADARGIVAPDAGLQQFSLERFAPSAEVGRFVAWYWVVTWDLRGRPSHTQHVFAHPVVNLTFEDGGPGMVNGVTTRMSSKTLTGAGRALGVMFRPAGFRPLLRRSMSTLTDCVLPFAEVVDERDAEAMGSNIASASDASAMAAATDAHMARLLPHRRLSSEATSDLVEWVATDPARVRVEDLAAQAGCTMRQLQRRFADHVGVSPKAVVRRYRLYEAAERARRGTSVDWAGIATELGYSDQAHLTRDFTVSFGIPPGRYWMLNQVTE